MSADAALLPSDITGSAPAAAIPAAATLQKRSFALAYTRKLRPVLGPVQTDKWAGDADLEAGTAKHVV